MSEVDYETVGYRAQYKQPYARQDTPPPIDADHPRAKDDTSRHLPTCDEPKDAEESDLCAQWGMVIAAENQVKATWVETTLLFVTILTGFFAIGVAIRSNFIAQDNAIADRRAWLDIHAAAASDWIRGGTKPDRVKIRFEITNIGKSPAFSADVHARMFIFAPEWPAPFDQQATEAEVILAHHDHRFGHTVFPGDKAVSRTRQFEMTEPEVRRVVEQLESTGDSYGDKGLSVYIAGCIQYLIQGMVKPRQTGFVFAVERQSPDGGIDGIFFGVDVPADQLILRPLSVGPNAIT